MASRKKISDSTQTDVLVQSRRRCCLCFGLDRDEGIKKGQIAHLDGDRTNNSNENLAFLCLEHHDEFDSTTSQSKGLLVSEVKKYREELYYHFGNWAARLRRDELLSFLASQIDLNALVDGAVKAAGQVVFYGESHAFDVLISDQVDYSDGDLYLPHLMLLDHFASWGWLTYTSEERGDRLYICVERKPICDEVAAKLLERTKARPDDHKRLVSIAEYRLWRAPIHFGVAT